MRTTRLLSAAALVVAATIALSGCSIFTDGERVWGLFQEEEAAKTVLNETVADLQKLDGVSEASSVFDKSGPGSLEAEIAVTAEPDATVAQLRAVALLASEALGGEVLSPRTRAFTLSAGKAIFTQNHFGIDAERVADEVEYWTRARQALGIPLLLAVNGSVNEYWREFRPAKNSSQETVAAVIDGYARLLAVADPSSVPTGWFLPGLSSGGLAPIEVIELLDDLSGIVPLTDTTSYFDGWRDGDEFPSGVALTWQPEWQSRPAMLAVILRQGNDREIAWATAVSVAELALRSHAASFVFAAGSLENPEEIAEFSTIECPWKLDASEKNVALADALAAKGVPIPEDVVFGTCIYIEPTAP